MQFTVYILHSTIINKYYVENQINIIGYEVEKSTDGSQFHLLGHVAVINNYSGTATYQLPDANPANGTNYYRVKIIDHIGANKYSSVVKMLLNEEGNILLYQNPVTHNTI